MELTYPVKLKNLQEVIELLCPDITIAYQVTITTTEGNLFSLLKEIEDSYESLLTVVNSMDRLKQIGMAKLSTILNEKSQVILVSSKNIGGIWIQIKEIGKTEVNDNSISSS